MVNKISNNTRLHFAVVWINQIWSFQCIVVNQKRGEVKSFHYKCGKCECLMFSVSVYIEVKVKQSSTKKHLFREMFREEKILLSVTWV